MRWRVRTRSLRVGTRCLAPSSGARVGRVRSTCLACCVRPRCMRVHSQLEECVSSQNLQLYRNAARSTHACRVAWTSWRDAYLPGRCYVFCLSLWQSLPGAAYNQADARKSVYVRHSSSQLTCAWSAGVVQFLRGPNGFGYAAKVRVTPATLCFTAARLRFTTALLLSCSALLRFTLLYCCSSLRTACSTAQCEGAGR